ncbi:MAG: hypothetical protein MJY44_04120 [Bacteroidales bacterium]|nr:hypothetical protein [Bacteroidales bacterium]
MGGKRIAKVLKSNGVDGDVLVGLLDGAPEAMHNGEPVLVEFDGLPVPFFVESFTPRGGTKAVIHLTDVSDLKSAEELVGAYLFSAGADEDEPEEDFTGWTLFDDGVEVGVIDGLEPIPGNPCLQVGDALIPLHEDFVERVDSEARAVYMHLPDGLL